MQTIDRKQSHFQISHLFQQARPSGLHDHLPGRERFAIDKGPQTRRATL
jgi:hypothetical protein